MVMGTIGEASVLLPVLASDAPSLDTTRLIYSGLLKYDRETRLVGDLARSWEVSADNRTIRFRLREDVLWHDGLPFTSRDVEYTFRAHTDPTTPTPWASDFLKASAFRCLDDHTVEVSYEEPYAPALDSWTQGILPRHLLEGTPLTESPLQRSPVGTGPYRFVSWESGQQIVLEANPRYFGEGPFLSRVTIRPIPDPAAMFLLLKAGELSRMDLTPLQYTRQTANDWFKNRFRKYRYLHFGYTYLGYNGKDGRFQDRRVRQALTMAINRERIIKCVLMGLGRVAHSPYNPDTMWHNPRARRFPHDPALARELLSQAGWRDENGDGILEKDGRDFEFTIVTNHGNDMRKNAATLIQRDLKEVGIRVKIRVIEWAALLKNFIHKRNFEACLLGWRVGVDPNQIDIWDSAKTAKNCLNFLGYRNVEVDRLLRKGVRTHDIQERRLSYARFQELLAEDQPCTFLWVQEDLPIISSRFHGIDPAPMGIDHNLPQWYVPERFRRSEMQP